MVAIPLLQKNAPFESLSEFAPVSLVGRLRYIWCILNPDWPR
jgi:hypothetical protein